MGLFDKIKKGLQKTSDAVSRSLDAVFAGFVTIDDDLLEELEEALILSDVGAANAAKIVMEVERRAQRQNVTSALELRYVLKDTLLDMMLDNQPLDVSGKPAVVLVIGVNGVGKTTSIGKLAARYVGEGKKVMLAAADTFRAAAADQLEIWAKRAGADIVRHGEGADPAAVVFDSISAAKARGSDVIIIDTAGRLHNKANLMNELAKIDRVIAMVFLLAGALAGLAGITYGMKYNIYPTMGNVGLKAFIASVIGGLGSVPGAIAGALLLGLIETVVSGYISSGLRDLISFCLLIVILLVRPSGLFGVDVQEKA